jgi:glycerol-3-phosphate cytidylyltransferase
MKIGFTCSTFDLFHAGHVAMLEEAKKHCDWLIVGIQTDPTIDRPEKNKPVQSLIERQLQVRACKYVDETIVYATEQDLLALLCMLPIDIRILGEEYRDKPFTGHHLRGMEYYFNKRDHGYSSSELRLRIENAKGLRK